MAATQKPLSFSLCPDNINYILDLVAERKKTDSRFNRSVYMDDLITEIRLKDEAKTNKKPKLAVLDLPYPDNLNIAAWDKWIEFRKMAKFKKYKSDATMKKLAKMGDHETQMLIVQQSIDNEYQGLFALRGGNNGQTQNTSPKLSAYERTKKRNDELYRQPNERELGVGADGGHLGGAVDPRERGDTFEHVDNQPFIDY